MAMDKPRRTAGAASISTAWAPASWLTFRRLAWCPAHRSKLRFSRPEACRVSIDWIKPAVAAPKRPRAASLRWLICACRSRASRSTRPFGRASRITAAASMGS